MAAAYTDSDDPDNHEHVLWAPDNGEGLGDKVKLDKEWAAQFHVYTMVWSECCMDFFLDGRHMNRITFHDHLDAAARPRNPYSGPRPLATSYESLILRFHTTQRLLRKWHSISGQLKMEVDYVRYYVPVPSPPPTPPPLPPPPPVPPRTSASIAQPAQTPAAVAATAFATTASLTLATFACKAPSSTEPHPPPSPATPPPGLFQTISETFERLMQRGDHRAERSDNAADAGNG